MNAPLAGPFDGYRDVVRPEWIDDNGHMNMGYYLVVFDIATTPFIHFLGITPEYRRQHNVTTFAAESHILYHREVKSGDPLRFEARLLDVDAKRIHFAQQMWHADEGFLSATVESLSLHIDLATRRVAPMRPELLDRMAAIKAAHATLPPLPMVGRKVSVRPQTLSSSAGEGGRA